MSKKKGSGLKLLLALMIIALLAVAAIILVKQIEYGQSELYYDNLRGTTAVREMRA